MGIHRSPAPFITRDHLPQGIGLMARGETMSANLEQTSFLFGSNAGYVAELYASYLSNPAAVDPSWNSFFQDLDEDSRAVLDELRGASWTVSDLEDPKAKRDPVAESFIVATPNGAATNGAAAAMNGPGNGAMLSHTQQVYGGISPQQLRAATLDSIRALMLIRVFRVRGHMNAHFDPLGLEKREPHPELDPATYGFGPDDLDRPIFLNYSLGLETATLRQILDILHKTYCGTIGVEFMHIQDPEEKAWIQERIEGGRNHTDFTVNGKRAILERLTAAEGFEKFLQLKYTGTKRFGLEGGESMIPALEQILKRGGQLGLKEAVVGMAHRGRLNMLTNFMGKPFSAVFSEFQGNPSSPEDVQGSGDVKYHLGTSSDRDFNGNIVHLSLTANPSHLEWVNPVVLGKVRAKQQQRRDLEREQVMGVLIHGDAAFAGQGIVAETLGLSELRGYRTGGTMHFIINNQIGFTTNPTYSRSGVYCSDMAKMVQAPIFHVNGDDPEAVVHVSRIAIEFRQKFKRDVVIDMVCYRRHGHNEGDEPGFTQPIMYKNIRSHATTRELYAKQLVAENVITQSEGDQITQDFMKKLEAEFEASSTYKPNKADWLEGKWAGLEAQGANTAHRGETGVELDTLKQIGFKLCEYPKDFAINSKIARQLEAKKKTLETGEGIDWATAEALAYGTLVAEGTGVRLSGQDSGRGTFSHRHAVMYDQNTEEKYVPLCHVSPDQATFEPAVGSRRRRLRVRLFAGRAAQSGAVGSAVRRFRQHRADHHRPVHLVGRVQVAAHVRPGDAAAARLRGPGSGTLVRPSGTLPADVRRGQLADLQRDDAGQPVPRLPPPDPPQLPQAAGAVHAEVAAAPQAVHLRPVGDGSGQHLPPRAGRDRQRSGRQRQDPPHRRLLRQGLLRPAAGAHEPRHQGRRHPAPGTALPVPEGCAGGRVRQVSERRAGLVPGRAGEPGRLVLRRPPPGSRAEGRRPQGRPPVLCRPPGHRLAGDRPAEAPQQGAGQAPG
ncbi:hypothetical protein Lal_00005317 [Lupinus albus]|nr:hypothetical protein Lal_00005317 [Lupinus albus]